MNSLQTIALQWHQAGVCAIPCEPRSKAPMVRWSKWMDGLPYRETVKAWFCQEECNLALVTGGPGRLLVLDFDDMSRYVAWCKDNPKLAESYTVATPRPGRHVYFRSKLTSTMHLDGIDVRGTRACITAPPSVHPSGQRYEVVNDAPILWVDSLTDALPCWEDSVKGKEGSGAIAPFSLTESPSPEQTHRNDLIGRVRASLPIASLLSRYTTPIPSSQDGRWYVMRCPHPQHLDANPSFWCDAARGICGCFKPECTATQPSGKPMDIFNLYGWIHGLDNGPAIRQLAREVGEY